MYRQLAQLQSELAQLKTDEAGLVAMARANPDAEPEPDAELYTRMYHMAEVRAASALRWCVKLTEC